MTSSMAIRLNCLDCSGCGKEVTLSVVFDCPLWEYRFGGHYKATGCLKRMETAKKQFPKELLEIKLILQKNGNEYFSNIQNKATQTHTERFFELNV